MPWPAWALSGPCETFRASYYKHWRLLLWGIKIPGPCNLSEYIRRQSISDLSRKLCSSKNIIGNGKGSSLKTDRFGEKSPNDSARCPIGYCAVTKTLFAVGLFLYCASVIETPSSALFFGLEVYHYRRDAIGHTCDKLSTSCTFALLQGTILYSPKTFNVVRG